MTSGGVSAGAFDHTRDVVRHLGGDIRIDRIRMRPGAPLGFGMIRGTPWLGLPGNPVSALVTFELFGRPLIRKLRGERAAVSAVPVSCRHWRRHRGCSAPLMHFLRAIVDDGRGRTPPRATHRRRRDPGLLTSMARANALLLAIPPERQVDSLGAVWCARCCLGGAGS